MAKKQGSSFIRKGTENVICYKHHFAAVQNLITHILGTVCSLILTSQDLEKVQRKAREVIKDVKQLH